MFKMSNSAQTPDLATKRKPKQEVCELIHNLLN